MPELADIQNEFLRQEIADYIERPDERARILTAFVKASRAMQKISAALIEGQNKVVDQLTREALEAGTSALEVMDTAATCGISGHNPDTP